MKILNLKVILLKDLYHSVNRYTDTNEPFRSEGNKDNIHREVRQWGAGSKDVVFYIKRYLVASR